MHILILGNSFTGKSNLAKSLAQKFAERGEDIIVYDPLKSRGWPAKAEKFASAKKFFEHVRTAQNAHVFCDEAATLWGEDNKQADRLLYNRRHQGLLVYLIAQRASMIRPNGRNQCSTVMAFRQQLDDAQTLAAEYHPDMMQVIGLEDTYFYMARGTAIYPMQLDFSHGEPPRPVPATEK